MSQKNSSTITHPPSAEQLRESLSGAELAARWAETRLVYPLYAALAIQFNFAPLPHPAGELPPVRPTREVFDHDTKLLDEIDDKVRAFQIRQIPSEILNASEPALSALIRRQLRKPDKTTVDRDKIDLLLVQYFALCASEELCRGEIGLGDVAQVLQPVLPEADATPLEWCQPLEDILQNSGSCQSLRDLMEGGLLEQGRLLKDSAGCMFYDPAALVAFCRFNFLLRRAFIRLLHADLSAVSQAIEALHAKGVRSVDCRRAGFSAAETTVRLRHFCENWRQPFQKDYTESSVNQAFEQLLALRADLEEALSSLKLPTTSTADPAASEHEKGGETNTPAEDLNPDLPPTSATALATGSQVPPEADAAQETSSNGSSALSNTRPASPIQAASQVLGKPAKRDVSTPASPTGAAEAEKCLEAIWEQLIAAPPARGRSMSTVTLEDTKVLLSSWEVSAFVSEGGQESEDLRRAVVARALLAVAMDQRKRSGEENGLASSLALARAEVSYFQERVEQAKRAKNTEAAVNLGISTKRLLSVIEEAEKL
jgi:hypothetical protein